MKILKWLAIVVVSVVVLFIGIGFALPGTYEVERSVSIAAPPEKVHSLVGDLERWPDWSPWTDGDPTIETTLGTKTRGVGASQSWTGDSGSGELTFTSTDPARGVEYDLSFEGGAWTSVAVIAYEPAGPATTVRWIMRGDNSGNPVGAWFALMMVGWVGPMFELGLGKLKAAAER